MLLHSFYLHLISITAEAMTGALTAGRRRMDYIRRNYYCYRHAIGGGIGSHCSARSLYPLGWVKHPEYVIGQWRLPLY